MVKQIIHYPTPLGMQYATDVRVFDEALFALIDDLKDTIKENNLDGLAALQIGNYYNVIVVRDEDGKLLEMVNPRLIAHEGKTTQKESTLYYGDLEAEIQRHEKICVVYQDRDGKDCSLEVGGALARVIQRKIDYTFGATFILKMSKKERELFEKALEEKYHHTHRFKKSWLLKGLGVIAMMVMLFFVYSLFG